MATRRAGLLTTIIVLSLLTSGCDELDIKDKVSRLARYVSGVVVNDLDEARIAIRQGEWERAEKYLERFLRVATDPEERWEAWISLVDATERAGQDRRWINEYLEAMLVEFEDSPERLRHILYKMSASQEAARQYERAVITLFQLVSLPDLTVQERLELYKRLAFMQMRLNRLQGAEESLHECLGLPLADSVKADCLYFLADICVLREDLEDGANIAIQILDTPGVPPLLYSKATFLLADIYEQQKKYQDALRLYVSIRNSYPNPMAVDARIDYLKKKLKK